MAIAQLLLAARGLSGEKDPHNIVTGDLNVANNADFSASNLLQKEGGSVKINSTPISGAPKIVCGFDWWSDPSTQTRVISTDNGKLYKDDMSGGFGTTLKTGLTNTSGVMMTEGGAELVGRNKKLFIPNGHDPVQILSGNGATTSDISKPPADWAGVNQPTFLFNFRGYMVGGGAANNLHAIYGSTATDHEDFQAASAWAIPVYPAMGQKVVSGIDAFGRGYLFKYPRGVFWIDETAASPSGWFCKVATSAYGIANSPNAVVAGGEDKVFFVGPDGSINMMYQTAGSLSGVEFIDLTKLLNLKTLMSDNFNLALLAKTYLQWYPYRQQLIATFAALGSTTLTRRLVLDFNLTTKQRPCISIKDTQESLWMEIDSSNIRRPIIGDATGTVWKLDQLARNIGGVAYPLDVTTTPTDLSDETPSLASASGTGGFQVKKLFYRLHMEYEVTGNFDVSVGIYIDGVLKGTVTFNQGTSGSQLPFTLPGSLGGYELRRRSRDITGEGYYISLRVLETSLNNPQIARMWVEFDPLVMGR